MILSKDSYITQRTVEESNEIGDEARDANSSPIVNSREVQKIEPSINLSHQYADENGMQVFSRGSQSNFSNIKLDVLVDREYLKIEEIDVMIDYLNILMNDEIISESSIYIRLKNYIKSFFVPVYDGISKIDDIVSELNKFKENNKAKFREIVIKKYFPQHQEESVAKNLHYLDISEELANFSSDCNKVIGKYNEVPNINDLLDIMKIIIDDFVLTLGRDYVTTYM